MYTDCSIEKALRFLDPVESHQRSREERAGARFAAAVEVTTSGDDPQVVLRKVFQEVDYNGSGMIGELSPLL